MNTAAEYLFFYAQECRKCIRVLAELEHSCSQMGIKVMLFNIFYIFFLRDIGKLHWFSVILCVSVCTHVHPYHQTGGHFVIWILDKYIYYICS